MIDEKDIEVTSVINYRTGHERWRYEHLPTGVALSDDRFSGDGDFDIFNEHMFYRLDACVKADRALFA